nr:porin [bacterium]
RLTASLMWKIDCDSRLNARFRANDHERPFEPDRSYEELLLDLTYFRQLSCEWALKLRGMGRNKVFGDPTNDMNERLTEAELTYQPSEEWTWIGSVQRDVYDYADPIRAFVRDRWKLGAQYYYCDLSLGADYEHQVNSYDSDADRDWQRDTLSFNLGYKHCRHDIRLYAQLGMLDQSDPASVNDYDETQLSATWSYEIDGSTDLILSYEDRQRKYDLQPAIRDKVVEARLKFEL